MKSFVSKAFFIILFILPLTIRCPIQIRAEEFLITIDVSRQKLFLFENVPFENPKLIKTYPVSTSKYGIGNEKSSMKTPLGTHFIAEKIGDGAKIGTIFELCENTGEIAEIYTDAKDIKEDVITTRILSSLVQPCH